MSQLYEKMTGWMVQQNRKHGFHERDEDYVREQVNCMDQHDFLEALGNTLDEILAGYLEVTKDQKIELASILVSRRVMGQGETPAVQLPPVGQRIRVVIDNTGGAWQASWANHPVEVLLMDLDSDTVSSWKEDHAADPTLVSGVLITTPAGEEAIAWVQTAGLTEQDHRDTVEIFESYRTGES